MKEYKNPICKEVVTNIRDPFIIYDDGKIITDAPTI